jgi:choline dehydrogenase-like flavoprotein
MISKTGADVVIAGTGIVGCLIAEQMLDAGLGVDARSGTGH